MVVINFSWSSSGISCYVSVFLLVMTISSDSFINRGRANASDIVELPLHPPHNKAHKFSKKRSNILDRRSIHVKVGYDDHNSSGNSVLLPKMTTSMKDISGLLEALKQGIPFSFAHFNDGEVKALSCQTGEKTDRGWQRCSSELNKAMFGAMTRRADNFYFGIVCPCSNPTSIFLDTLKLLPRLSHGFSKTSTCPPYHLGINGTDAESIKFRDRLTVGDVFVNGNYLHSRMELIKIFNNVVNQGRDIHVVVGEKHNVSALPFVVKTISRVSNTNAFDNYYHKMRTTQFVNDVGYHSEDIVLLLCGPLGRILASEWSLLYSNITFLDMGSFWDSYLWGSNLQLDGQYACMYETDYNGVVA